MRHLLYTILFNIHELLLPIAIAVFLCGVAVFLALEFGSESNLDRVGTAIEEESNIERFLANANEEELIKRSESLTLDRVESLVVRLDNLRQRIAISDRLLEMEISDEETGRFAVRSKLGALVDRQIVCLTEETTSERLTSELSSFAELNYDSSDASISSLASVARAVVELTGHLEKSVSGDLNSKKETALKAVGEASRKSSESIENADRLFTVIQHLNSRFGPDSAGDFALEFREAYAGSKFGKIERLVARAELIVGHEEFELVRITDAVESERMEAAEKLVSQIEDGFDHGIVSNSLISYALTSIADLARVNLLDHAGRIRDVVSKNIDQLSEKSQLEFNRIEKKLSSIGRIYSIEGLVDIENQPAEFKKENAQFKLLFFASSGTQEESIEISSRIRKTMRNAIIRGHIEFSIIYLFGNNSIDQHQLGAVKRMAKTLPNINVWLLNVDHESGKTALAGFPLEMTPYVLVLTNKNKIAMLNPTLEELEKIVVLIRSQQER